MLTVSEKRMRVGKRPTGLVVTGPTLRVLESGVNALSTYDSVNGRRMDSVPLIGSPDPLMFDTQFCGNLLLGSEADLLAWTVQSSLKYFRVRDRSLVSRTEPVARAVRDWVHHPGSGQTLVSVDGSDALTVLSAELVPRTVRLGFEVGSVLVGGLEGLICVASSSGDQIAILDRLVGRVVTQLDLRSRLGRFVHAAPQLHRERAPLAFDVDGRTVLCCPWLSDDAQFLTPLAMVRAQPFTVDVVDGIGIRFPRIIRVNRILDEVYVVGHDQTVAVSTRNRRVTRVLGGGRQIAFEVAPSGLWAIGISLDYQTLTVFDLVSRTSRIVELSGGEPGEFAGVPIVIDAASHRAITLDVPAAEVLVIEVAN